MAQIVDEIEEHFASVIACVLHTVEPIPPSEAGGDEAAEVDHAVSAMAAAPPDVTSHPHGTSIALAKLVAACERALQWSKERSRQQGGGHRLRELRAFVEERERLLEECELAMARWKETVRNQVAVAEAAVDQ